MKEIYKTPEMETQLIGNLCVVCTSFTTDVKDWTYPSDDEFNDYND